MAPLAVRKPAGRGLMPDGLASTLVRPGNVKIVNMSERCDRLGIFAKG
jgi:hypothetical protein